MSSRTSISAPDGTAGRLGSPFRRARPALLAVVFLTLLLTVVSFDTRDARGMRRDKTAGEVWTTVGPRLSGAESDVPLRAIYAGALIVTLLGAFALIVATEAVAPHREEYVPDATVVTAWRAGARALRAAADYPSFVTPRKATAAALAIAALVAWRVGTFAIEGSETGLADGFADMDHPFHVARAELLRRSLADGQFLRWVAAHQGGYPAEFYPLGLAYGVVALWGLFLGSLPVAVVHKFVVVAIFLAPVVLYFGYARRDRWPPIVGLTAFVVHVSIPGGYWHGGYSELLYVGLASNVAAAVAVAFSLGWTLDALQGHGRRSVALAALAAAAAIWCNPRSAIGLLACGAGAWIAVVLRERSRSATRCATYRLIGIALLAGLLSAPEIVSLLRFRDLYYFLHYTSYSSSADFLSAVLEAVSLPVFPLVVLGGLAAFLVPPDRVATRAVTFSLVLYVSLTLAFSFSGDVARLMEQLEPTRLMTLQRVLMVYLAAVGLHAVSVIVIAHAPRFPARAEAVEIAIAGVVLLAWLTPSALVPRHVSSPSELARSSRPEMVSFERAVASAAAAAPPGTAVLIAGTNLSAHQQLWAPVISDRLFFYDSWMWSWHKLHAGPYDPRAAWEYDPDRMAEVFSRKFLREHGIGAVVATGEWNEGAAAAADLRPVWRGAHSPYVVVDPSTVVTIDGRAPASVSPSNHRIEVRHPAGGRELVVRQNWFPRWRAEINGQPASIDRTPEGYMCVQLPEGPVHALITYSLQPSDVAARTAGLLGLVCVLLLVAPRKSV